MLYGTLDLEFWISKFDFNSKLTYCQYFKLRNQLAASWVAASKSSSWYFKLLRFLSVTVVAKYFSYWLIGCGYFSCFSYLLCKNSRFNDKQHWAYLLTKVTHAAVGGVLLLLLFTTFILLSMFAFSIYYVLFLSKLVLFLWLQTPFASEYELMHCVIYKTTWQASSSTTKPWYKHCKVKKKQLTLVLAMP